MTSPVQKFSVDQLYEAIGTIKISVTHKGRAFILENGTRVKMKDFVKRAAELSKDEKIESLKAQLISLDLRGKAKLEKASCLTRLLARLYQIFGNGSFSQEKHFNRLDSINKVDLTEEQKQFIKDFTKVFDEIKSKHKETFEKVHESILLTIAGEMIETLNKQDQDADPNLIKERKDKFDEIKLKLNECNKEIQKSPPDEKNGEAERLFDNFKGFETQIQMGIMKNIKDPCLLSTMVIGANIRPFQTVSELKGLRQTYVKAIKMAKYY